MQENGLSTESECLKSAKSVIERRLCFWAGRLLYCFYLSKSYAFCSVKEIISVMTPTALTILSTEINSYLP